MKARALLPVMMFAVFVACVPALAARIQPRQVADYAVRNTGDSIHSATAYLTINATTPEAQANLFAVQNNGTDRFVVEEDGDVTVSGNLAVQSGLSVAGNAVIDGSIRAADGAGLRIEDDDGNLGVFVEDGGFVGINRIDPACALDVEGTIKADNGSLVSYSPSASNWVQIQALGSGEGMFNIAGFATVKTCGSERVRFDRVGNLLLGTTAANASASKNLGIAKGVAPATGESDMVHLYAEAATGTVELRVMDEAGNVTTLSPHNFALFEPDPTYALPWSYYSKNVYLGREINVDMYRAIHLLEQLTGEQLIHQRQIAAADWRSAFAAGDQPEVIVIPADEAFEDVFVTEQVPTGETRREYRLVEEEGRVETVEVPLTRTVYTGRTVKQLKPGVQFETSTGTFYRVRKAAPPWLRERLPEVGGTELTSQAAGSGQSVSRVLPVRRPEERTPSEASRSRNVIRPAAR